MRARRFKSQADIDRYVALGYGQGQGADYQPWLRVQDVPSQGRSRKVAGIKVKRTHHLLSDLEFAYFLALEFSEDVIDIREQYPLFPVPDLQEIAQARAIRCPKYAGTDLPFVLTTDFLVTFRAKDGTTQLAARTVKYSKELQPSKALERTLQKLELEKAFWEVQGISWSIVTELVATPTLSENLQWIRPGAVVDRHLAQITVQERFLEVLDRLNPGERVLAANIRLAGNALHMPYKDTQLLFKHLVWTKAIVFDLKSGPIRLTGTIPDWRCMSPLEARPTFEAAAA